MSVLEKASVVGPQDGCLDIAWINRLLDRGRGTHRGEMNLLLNSELMSLFITCEVTGHQSGSCQVQWRGRDGRFVAIKIELKLACQGLNWFFVHPRNKCLTNQLDLTSLLGSHIHENRQLRNSITNHAV